MVLPPAPAVRRALPALSAAAVATAVAAGCLPAGAAAAPSAARSVTAAAAGAKAPAVYVADYQSDSVTRINSRTATATTAVAPVASPVAVAFTPTATRAYAVDAGGGVTPIVTRTGKARTPIATGQVAGLAAVVSLDGSTLWLSGTTATGNVVVPITLSTGHLGAAVPVGSEPDSLALSPDGKTLYVANQGSDSVTPVSTVTRTAGTPIAVSSPYGLALTPDGTTLFVADNQSNGRVTPITTATGAVGTPIATNGRNPHAVVVTPDGRTVFVANYASGTVTPVDVATLTAQPPVGVGTGAYGETITPDGRSVYVSNNLSDDVSVLDVASSTVVATVPAGGSPEGVAVQPDQAPVARFSVVSPQVDRRVTFSAAASTVRFGSIARYTWHFGSRRVVTTTPQAVHRFRSAGQHKVRLTVTDSAGTSTHRLSIGVLLRNGRPRAATSASVTAYAVTATLTDAQAKAGSTVHLHGGVRPALPGRPVLLQRRASGHWQTRLRGTLSKHSHYRFAISVLKGSHHYRVVVPHSAHRVALHSHVRTLQGS